MFVHGFFLQLNTDVVIYTEDVYTEMCLNLVLCHHSLSFKVFRLCGILRSFQSVSLSQRCTRLKNLLMRTLASALTAGTDRDRLREVITCTA